MNLNYENLGLIGRGAFGSVFKAVDTDNERMVALKQVRISRTAESGIPCSTLREIAWLRHLEVIAHPNIVRLFDVFQTTSSTVHQMRETFLTLVFEYVDQDLASFLEKYPTATLTEDEIKDIAKQLLEGLSFLHSHRLIHRDLKPQNILVTRNRQIKIADFGLSRVYNFCVAITSVVVTLWYRAPEVLLQSQYGMSVDIWSAGCIFAELYLRRALFPGQSDVDQLHKIFGIIGTPAAEQWPESVHLPWTSFEGYQAADLKVLIPGISTEALALLQDMLLFDSEQRITAAGAVLHKFFIENESSQDSGISVASSATDMSNDSGLETDLHNLSENEGRPRKRARLMDSKAPQQSCMDLFGDNQLQGTKTGHDVACQADEKDTIVSENCNTDDFEVIVEKEIPPKTEENECETDESFCNISLS